MDQSLQEGLHCGIQYISSQSALLARFVCTYMESDSRSESTALTVLEEKTGGKKAIHLDEAKQ